METEQAESPTIEQAEAEIDLGVARRAMYLQSPNRSVMFAAPVKSKRYKGFEVQAGQVLDLPFEALLALRAEFGTEHIFDVTARPIPMVVSKLYAPARRGNNVRPA